MRDTLSILAFSFLALLKYTSNSLFFLSQPEVTGMRYHPSWHTLTGIGLVVLFSISPLKHSIFLTLQLSRRDCVVR